ncbi:SOS response-associated peptidase [Georgenia sunbinii]|uniref:SOS response-associated peptidase n=1 Tax=Georgenia sunbinii TaxID=3117728 RepID=UPI002F26101C
MCGRYASFRQAQDIAREFDVIEITEEAESVHPSFNVAPTDSVRVVLERTTDRKDGPLRREMHAARWGLVPGFVSDPRSGPPLINARIETVAEKRSFASSLVTRRCIVPGDGYFEWRKDSADPKKKTPFFIHRADAAPLAFAGLYAFWRDPAKEDDDPTRWLLSTTILTRPARADLAGIHDREPVVLRRKDIARWLDPTLQDAEEALGVPLPSRPRLGFHRVGPEVGNVRVDNPALLEPVD